MSSSPGIVDTATRTRWEALVDQKEASRQADLSALWDDLPTARTQDVLGVWAGFAFSTGHFLEKVLRTSGWYGKHFASEAAAQPLVCRNAEGDLVSDVTSGRGEASLWNVEFRGEVTASMVYDGMAVIDHFKWAGPDALMGVMNGASGLVLHHGEPFWFGLSRVGPPTTLFPPDTPGGSHSAASTTSHERPKDA